MSQELKSLTTHVVTSYVEGNAIAAHELPALIASVFVAFEQRAGGPCNTGGRARPKANRRADPQIVHAGSAGLLRRRQAVQDAEATPRGAWHDACGLSQRLRASEGISDDRAGLQRHALRARQIDRARHENKEGVAPANQDASGEKGRCLGIADLAGGTAGSKGSLAACLWRVLTVVPMLRKRNALPRHGPPIRDRALATKRSSRKAGSRGKGTWRAGLADPTGGHARNVWRARSAFRPQRP